MKRILLGIALAAGLNSLAAADAVSDYIQRKKVMTPMMTSKPGYGGEVIGFKEENDFLFALHRVWTLKPQERRMERIVSPHVADRIITNGCINVQSHVYEKLRQYFILEII